MENNQQPSYEKNPEVTGNAKTYAILSYISFLWIIGLLATPERDIPYVKNHVNNGITLTLITLASSAIGFIPLIGGFLTAIISVATLVICILGIIDAYHEKYYYIPYIGEKIQFIK